MENTSIKPDETRVAYLAGYFDSRACITASAHYYPLVVVSSANRTILEKLQLDLAAANLPGGYIKPFAETNATKKHMRYQLVFGSTAEVVSVLTRLAPYMNIRRPEATLVLDLIRLKTQPREVYLAKRDDILVALRGEKKRRGTLRQKYAHA